jgi:hypothetical protein
MSSPPPALRTLATSLLALALLLSGCGLAGHGSLEFPGGTTITAPAETWTWIPVPGAACGNGAATGFGVNLTGRSSDVVVYFQGGGACWDQLTCLTLQTATAVQTGYGAAQFATEGQLALPAFSRAPTSPFRDASLIFVPYCTGDLHAGTAVNSYGATQVHHVGGLNTGLFLEKLAATFPGKRRVYVAGSSAGGYAAQLNYARFAEKLPQAELHLLADGAQAIHPVNGNYPRWLAAWRPLLPAGCTGCATDLTALPAWLATTFPAGRFALTANMQDGVLQLFFGLSPAGMSVATRSLLDTAYTPNANARWFAVDSAGHTMLGNLATTGAGGVTLQDWLARWYGGDPAWASVGP